MKNITNMEQAINYARQANLDVVITDKFTDYYLEEYTTNNWSVVGEYGWISTLEEVLAMTYITCKVIADEELLVIVEDTGW